MKERDAALARVEELVKERDERLSIPRDLATFAQVAEVMTARAAEAERKRDEAILHASGQHTQRENAERERDAAIARVEKLEAALQKAKSTLITAYKVLAFCFNRLHGSARSRDGELCSDVGKCRAEIEKSRAAIDAAIAEKEKDNGAC